MMRTALLLSVAVCAWGADAPKKSAAYPTVKSLVDRAKGLTARESRVPLSPATASDRKPNFVRAMHLLPKAEPLAADLFDAMVNKGTIESEIKLAMGLRIAQIYDSPYLALHTERRLRATERGRALIAALDKKAPAVPVTAADLAVSYAGKLTKDVHGVTDDDFKRVRAEFNDGQVVELTTTTCYFNYLVRFAEGAGLPVEPWALDVAAAESKVQPPFARINLISDGQTEGFDAVVKRFQSQNGTPNSLGIRVANSMRAMMLAPDSATAWMNYGGAVREYAAVDRPLKLHVSFAVSMVNGCRYCTLHQVQGLRRSGISPSKLMAMKKDDSELSPRELTATLFARKLTEAPSSITDADYAKLKAEFGEQGALEVLLQTCTFAYMNRFTDGLRLPSEDEAIHTYNEVYGNKAYEGWVF